MKDHEEGGQLSNVMSRRGAMSFVLRSGAVLGLTRIADPDPADAAAPSVEFQKGKLSGGEFDGWEALLAITGQAVRGTIYDPTATSGGRITGYRVRGTVQGKILELDFFEIEDIGFDTSVGGGRGKENKRGKTTTNFEVGGKGNGAKKGGQMTSREVPISSSENKALAGTYAGMITDPVTGATLREFKIAATASGKFTLTEPSTIPAPGAPTSLAGRFGAARDGSIFFTVLLPKIVPGELAFDPSEVNLLRPANGEQGQVTIQQNPLAVLCGCELGTCGDLCAQPTGIVAGTVSEAIGPRRERPMAGVRVTLPGSGSTLTGADGAFSFPDVAHGAHDVIAEFDGYLTETRTIDLQSDRLNVPLLLRTPQRVEVRGHIEDSEYGINLVGAVVELRKPDTGDLLFSASSESGGNYSIQDVPEGSYRFRVARVQFEDRERVVSVRVPGPHTENFGLTATGVRLKDSDFPDANWESREVLQTGLGASFVSERAANEGNPGAYRRTTASFSGSSNFIITSHLFRGGSYNPSTQGRITSIKYSFESKLFAGGGESDHASHAFLIRQGGQLFGRFDDEEFFPAGAAWTRHSAEFLRQSDFQNLRSTGPEEPDFSAAGQPIEFGYLLGSLSPSEASGVDNWEIFIRNIAP